MTVGWGIVSTGRHPDLKVVPAMKLVDETRIAAACSRDLGRAETFAEKHGIPNAYDSLDALLGDPGVDAVFISSPNFMHARQTVQAAHAGKHVLVEKPMATSVEDAMEMVRACRDNGVKLGVGFHLRHHPAHVKVRELLRDGALGTVAIAQSQWCLGTMGQTRPAPRTGLSEWWGVPEMIGGASILMGTGVHVMDLLHFLVDEPIVEVSAITDGQSKDHPLERTAAIAVRFKSGVIGTIVCSRSAPDALNDTTIYGSQGRISLRDTAWEAIGGALEVVSESVEVNESYPSDLLTMYTNQNRAFNAAVSGGEEFRASGVDGLRVVQVTSAIIESAATGKSMKIEPAA